MIIVEGRLQNADYTDANGVKHYSMEVQADNVSFGETRKAAESQQNATQGNHNRNPQNYQSNTQNAVQSNSAFDMSGFEEILSDSEPPF